MGNVEAYSVTVPKKEFKVCPNCGSPDIHLGYDDKISVIVCYGCGGCFPYEDSYDILEEM